MNGLDMLAIAWDEEIVRVLVALVTAAVLAYAGYIVATLRGNHKKDSERDEKLDKLVQYHEGIPADDFLGLPAIPGVNDRLTHQEVVNRELAERQQQIISMVETGNGKTIGEKVDEIEKLASKALIQGSSALAAVKETQEVDKELKSSLDEVTSRLDRAEEERRLIMQQSLEGWRQYSEMLGVEPGDPPWIEWTKDKEEGGQTDGTV
jgi:hypothetical protein